MDRVARAAEAYIGRGAPNWDWRRLNAVNPVQDAIGRAVHDLCDDLEAKAVVAFSATGGTALFLSKNRPGVPIVAFTRDPAAARRMRLFWGVVPVLDDGLRSRDDLLAAARRVLPAAGICQAGDTFLAVTGTRFGHAGGTNAIEVGTL